MLGVAFGVGVLLALAGHAVASDCVAPPERVSDMLKDLEDSVKVAEVPNPSVLVAMSLAGATNSEAYKMLQQDIVEEAVKRAQKDMTSGEVALYVLALLSSCHNPQRVQALGQTLDLLHVLEQKTDEEMAELEAKGVPKTTLYSLGLDSLGLCLMREGTGYQGTAVALAKRVLSPDSHLSVDTRAVAAMAMACAYNRTDLGDVQSLLQKALSAVTNGFLDEQEKGAGMIGNIYSMGLALQALEATGEFYAPREWDCAQAFSVVESHDYCQPMAIAQVLPALVGKTYLQAAALDCASTSPNPGTAGEPRATAAPARSPRSRGDDVPRALSPRAPRRPAGPPPCPSDHPAADITVHYFILNKLRGEHFDFNTTVCVPRGSTLLRVLRAAEEKEPDKFSFRTEPTSWGPMVVSIHGLAASPADRTYWQFFDGQDSLQEGVGTYKPQADAYIYAVFSTY